MGTELGLQQCCKWLQLQQLLQCLFHVESLPAGMVSQPLRQSLVIQQEPEELEHQLVLLCQWPCQLQHLLQLQQGHSNNASIFGGTYLHTHGNQVLPMQHQTPNLLFFTFWLLHVTYV